ncbi:MAG TPA: isoprenylcysteine carboxylmethyltransferase family protein [Candidatus Limnocylindrales bacterium]
MSAFARWQRTERREPTRVAVTLLAGPVFLGLLPWLVVVVGSRLDRRLGLPPLPIRTMGRIVGGLLTATGYGLGFWAVEAQLDRGRGTPLPVMPTQELLTEGPFRYCRNPMTLGAILAYLGLAIASRTRAGMAFALVFGVSLLAYVKKVEEDELAARFGEPYLAYRRATPFLVPRLSARG